MAAIGFLTFLVIGFAAYFRVGMWVARYLYRRDPERFWSFRGDLSSIFAGIIWFPFVWGFWFLFLRDRSVLSRLDRAVTRFLDWVDRYVTGTEDAVIDRGQD